jgi:hypothetical protein
VGPGTTPEDDMGLQQIEYLLYQSTQGIHFIFENDEIARVLKQPNSACDTFSIELMDRVQRLLSGLLDKPSMREKQTYLESLNNEDYELIIRAYFQLVENTILSNTDIRH